MKKIVILILSVLMLCSCGAYKRLAYLQNMYPTDTYDVTQKPNARIAAGDELAISVASSFPQLVAPFNVATAVTIYDNNTQVESYKNAGNNVCSYMVDKEGKIEFPILGRIYVEGMTPEDLKNLIESEIKKRNYVKDPKVSVTFSNFKIYALGEVKKVGPINVPTGGINVFEAISIAGDLTDDALRDNVWVIRTTGDSRKIYTLNLKDRSAFDSPAFYLQQNDILYIAPKDTKRDVSRQNISAITTLVLTAVSTLGTVLLWFRVNR